MITTEVFGLTPYGEEVRAFTLRCGDTAVRVMDFGATLLGVTTPDASGACDDVVLGFEDFAGYLDDPACYGCTVGPSANRTDRGEVPLDGTVYQLPKNNGPGLRNNLHTDLERGLHKRLWAARVDEDRNAVTFSVMLCAGELGLPGNRTFTADYELGALDAAEDGDETDGNTCGGARLTLTYGCTTDAPTYVNLTNHAYFNLAGHRSGNALAQVLTVPATRFLPLRDDNVSAGDLRPVAETPFDFRRAKPLGRDIACADEQLAVANGYDHCLCVDGFDPAPNAAPRHALHARDARSGRTLKIDITAPGAHLYAGNWLDDTNAKDGASYGPHAGFAFEPEFYPDNMHHDDWPHPVCAPGSPYHSIIVYRFSAASTAE